MRPARGRIAPPGSALLIAALLVGAGCATAPPVLTDEGAHVQIGKGDPDPGLEEVGPIEAADGPGCDDLFNPPGKYKFAMTKLKNKAASMHADYVQIFTIIEPEASKCKRFVIRGLAFRHASSAPAESGDPAKR
jgi:hypothetical protein